MDDEQWAFGGCACWLGCIVKCGETEEPTDRGDRYMGRNGQEGRWFCH